MPKISELDAGTVTGTNLLAVAQGAATVKGTVNDVVKAGPVASTSVNGLMSSGDKTKLDGLSTGGGAEMVHVEVTNASSWTNGNVFTSGYFLSEGYEPPSWVNTVIFMGASVHHPTNDWHNPGNISYSSIGQRVPKNVGVWNQLTNPTDYVGIMGSHVTLWGKPAGVGNTPYDNKVHHYENIDYGRYATHVTYLLLA